MAGQIGRLRGRGRRAAMRHDDEPVRQEHAPRVGRHVITLGDGVHPPLVRGHEDVGLVGGGQDLSREDVRSREVEADAQPWNVVRCVGPR